MNQCGKQQVIDVASWTGSPLVSIIIPNYNYAHFLPQSIESALNQTYPHVEVIVVDDGSTDSSPDVIRTYGTRVTPILKENGGPTSALNEGFAQSRGDMVIFLDSDDVLFAEAVDRVLHAWKPGVAKVQYRLEVLDDKNRPTGIVTPSGPCPVRHQEWREFILSTGMSWHPPTSGNAYSREFLLNFMPIDTDAWPTAQDTYLGVLSPFYGDVIVLNTVLGFYRVHKSNTWVRTDFAPESIAKQVLFDVKRVELVAKVAQQLGLITEPELLLNDHMHFAKRLALRAVDPTRDPFPEDSAWSLARRGTKALWRDATIRPKTRLAYSAWFTLLPLLRGEPARHVARWGVASKTRPRILRRISGRKPHGIVH